MKSQITKLPVTVLVAAKNEEKNIGRCLDGLRPAARVVLLDSNSRDQTAALATTAGAEVVQFHYQGGYPKKRQWALENLEIRTPWVLLIDADEFVPDSLWEEMASELTKSGAAEAYLVTKGFHFLEKRFRFGGFSFGAVLLFRKGKARFERVLEDDANGLDMEVHERVIVDGRIGRLRTPLIHQDFKGLDAYLERHNRYSLWEARVRHAFLRSGRWGSEGVPARLFGNTQERRRFLKHLAVHVPFESMLWFLYHFVFRLGFLEGRRGLIAAQIRSCYIQQVRAKVYELGLEQR